MIYLPLYLSSPVECANTEKYSSDEQRDHAVSEPTHDHSQEHESVEDNPQPTFRSYRRTQCFHGLFLCRTSKISGHRTAAAGVLNIMMDIKLVTVGILDGELAQSPRLI
jgi:hypothetical protein